RFPAGRVDVTNVCRPGQTHTLSLHVVAMPLKAVMLSYTDTANARQVKGAVARRGLCGDVFLESTPATAIAATRAETSFRRGEIALTTTFRDLNPDGHYKLRA